MSIAVKSWFLNNWGISGLPLVFTVKLNPDNINVSVTFPNDVVARLNEDNVSTGIPSSDVLVLQLFNDGVGVEVINV